MATFPNIEWLRERAEAVNDDARFTRYASEFDARVCLGFGDETYVLDVSEGRIDEVYEREEFRSWDFAVRAPVSGWESLLSEVPPPFYNDLRSAWLREDVRIDGDIGLAARNWRPLRRMVDVFGEGDR